jgi:magnesium transporter
MANIDMNPLNAGVTYLYRKRILWLFALVFMNILSGAVLASFESTIQAVVSLVFFMPLLIASGGNTGAQSATLIIRSIATGDVETKDWFRLVFKELGVALLLGLTMGIGVAAVASIRAPEIILVVSLSMVTIVLIGALVGTTLPFLFIKLGADPATASVPLITCIADVTGILVYFTLATTLLG